MHSILDKTSFRVNLKKGNQLKQESKIDEAIVQYLEALQLNPNCIPALNQLTVIYSDRKEFDKSISCHQRIVNLQPDNYKAYARLARILLIQNHVEEAIVNLSKAINLHSEQPAWVYTCLGDALKKNGQVNNAVAAYRQAIKIEPSNSTLHTKLKAIESQESTQDKQVSLNQLSQKHPENLKVIKGKNNWLFLDNDKNQVNQQISGKKTFSNRELFKWKILLETRKSLLNQYNISYYFLVIPNKGCVYPEYLPDSVKLTDYRCINQLSNYLSDNSFAKLLYPLSSLKRAKENELPVYRLRDTHWTAFGAFVVYQYLMSEISKLNKTCIISASSVRLAQASTTISDLGNKLNIDRDIFINSEIDNPSSKRIFNNKIKNTGSLIIFENANQSLPKAVMFGDSFSSQLLIFLAESFSRLVVVWQPNLDYSVILNEKPDVVISEQVERFLVKIPDDIHGLSNQDRVTLKTKDLRSFSSLKSDVAIIS